MKPFKKIIKISAKVIAYILIGCTFLFFLVLIYINTNAGKKQVKKQVLSFLQKKLKTNISIGSIDYNLPNWIELNDVYVEDNNKDTLLYGANLLVDINMLKLLKNEIEINKVSLSKIYINIYRNNKDTTFNYNFIVNAFASKNDTSIIKDTTALKLMLSNVTLENVKVNFKDSFAGNNFNANIGKLNIITDVFQPDRNRYEIQNVEGNQITFTSNIYKPSAKYKSTNAVSNKTTEPYALFVSAKNINLSAVYFKLVNTLSNSLIENKTNLFFARNIEFNSGTKVATIAEIMGDKIVTTYSASTIKNTEIITTAPTSDTPPWAYTLNKINLTNSFIKYDDDTKAPKEGLDFNHLEASKINTTINNIIFSENKKSVNVEHFSFIEKSGFGLDTTIADITFTDKNIDAKNIYIKTKQSTISTSLSINFDSVATIITNPKKVIVNTLYNKSSIAINDIYLLAPQLKNALPKATFANQNIIINTAISGNLEILKVQNFELSGLSGSYISASGLINNITNTSNLDGNLFIKNSKFYKSDILKFVPVKQHKKIANLPSIINLSGKVVGNKNNVFAQLFTTASGFVYDGTILLKNITTPKSLQYATTIKKASISRQLITPFLSDTILQNIQLPSQISLSGNVKGNVQSVFATIAANTSFGGLSINGFIKNFATPKKAEYDIKLNANNFELGNILKKDTTVGNIDGVVMAKGRGFDFKTLQSKVYLHFNVIGYNKYNYHNVLIHTTANNGMLKSIGTVNDKNLHLNFDASADIKNTYPTLVAKITVDTAILKNLNFTTDTLNLSLAANIIFNNLQPRHLNAYINIDSIYVQQKSIKYNLDSIHLVATSSSGIDSINLHSPMLAIQAGGAFDYDKLMPSLLNYFNGYYNFTDKIATQNFNTNQQFGISAIVKQHPLVSTIIPTLTYYEPIFLNGRYNTSYTDSAFNFTIKTKQIVMGKNSIANLAVNLNSKNEALTFSAQVDTLAIASNKLYGTNLYATAAKDSLSINVITKDAKNIEWFSFGGYAFVKNNVYTYHLKDSLKLNYEKWIVASNNFVQYSPEGTLVNDFVINNDSASIAIKSTTLVPNSPILIDVNNFNLKSITSILNKDTLLVGGILDIKATVGDLNKPIPSFTGNANLQNLTYLQNLIGNITLQAQKKSENTIAANFTLLGNKNNIAIDANYFLTDAEKQFDADIKINALNVNTVQNFAPKLLENTSGNINGNINLQGKFKQPVWQGFINFDTTKIGLAQLGTSLKIDKQKIVLNYPFITFPAFTILDAKNNTLVVDGKLASNTLTDFDLDINIASKNFEVVNTPQKINSKIYGYAAVDVNVDVKGTTALPKIEGEILVKDKSDLKIILPAANYEKNEGKEIVRFVDLDTFKIEEARVGYEPAIEIKKAFAQFLNYNLNIDISKKAALTILIDPVTGDEIKVQGDARLNVGVDPGGNLVLAGVYDLDNGYYDLHYQILQRKFNLQKGSTITFAGAPLDATVNITAAYTANSASKDLLSKEVSNESPTLSNLFNQKIPFQVMLYLSGALNKPTINFDIKLPDDVKNINNELRTIIENKLMQVRNDPAAINKQVFSLLLFNKFASEQSSDFFKGNGGGFNDVARQSVSQFLSSALNEIASDLIKGIDIDLNLNTFNDFSNGNNAQRTDLNVAVSKSFANDRLTVSVGKNFGVEGQGATSVTSQANTGFKPDVTLSYKLTTDGKYMIRAYTKNQYEVTLDGYVMETGVSFLVTLSYDRFAELFNKKKR